MNKRYIYFFLGTLFLVILTFAIVTGGHENIGNPKVKDVLASNPNADLIKLDELIYINSALDSRDDQSYLKGDQIGEIRQKTSRTWWYGNLYATKLPKGTKVYTTDDAAYNKEDAPFVIIVELNREILVYHALIEG